MTDQIFIDEKARVDSTVTYLKEKKQYLEHALISMGAVTLDKLKELRHDAEGGLDLIISLQRLNEANSSFDLPDKYAQLEELAYLSKEPYFARIDLKDPKTGKEEIIYIGKFGVLNKDVSLVTDWRSKIASIYYKYRYPQKGVKYVTEKDKFEYDLTLKRSFEIDEGELIKYYNNDIQLDENEIIASKIKERTGGTLEDIIETIQESQLEIIESDPRQTCIVQGCVGSGKSTVAIHKLAYIFFNYANLIRAPRSILIAKNQILVSYLSTLFPKLGIFDINFKTIRDLLVQVIYKEKININLNFDDEGELEKYDLAFIEKLNKELDVIHTDCEAKIDAIFDNPAYASYGGFVYDRNIAVLQNIADLEDDLSEEIDMQREYTKNTDNTIKKEIHKENIKSIRKILSSLTKIKNETNTSFNKLLAEHKIKDGSVLNYTEALLYVYLRHEFFGFNKFLKFEYCVVDEGQDCSLLEYLLLGKFVLNGRFCILGDLNQSFDKAGLSRWEQIASVISQAKTAKVYELDTNYRSTKQIIDFANTVIGKYTTSYLPKPIERIGREPTQISTASSEELLKTFEEQIRLDIKELSKSIGVIVYDAKLFSQVDTLMSRVLDGNDAFIKLDSNKQMRYIPKGVYLTSFEDCKGLEFSKVYVLGLDLSTINSFNQAKSAFVAVTRAMNELIIIN